MALTKTNPGIYDTNNVVPISGRAPRFGNSSSLSCVELCAGGGGQALGLEWSGFAHQALVEIDAHCCETPASTGPTGR